MKKSGAENVFIENEIFGPGAVNTVMNGIHYVYGKRGMTLITKALHRLQVSNFLKVSDCSQFQNVFEKNGEDNVENNVHRIGVKREATNEKNAINHVLDCQKLKRAKKLVIRGQIPEKFVPGEPYEANVFDSSSHFDFVTWIMARYVAKSHLPEYSFSEKQVFHRLQPQTMY